MRSISEEQFRKWSQLLRRADASAFAEVFDQTYDALFRYASYITRDKGAAEDVLQDVYLKLWRVHETIDPDRSLRALMYQMVRNYALNHQRQIKRHALDSLDDLTEAPADAEQMDDMMDARSLHNNLSTWINQMPARRREAFMLSRYEGLSHDEIARLMNLTPKTVNNHIVLALQYLRDCLETYETRNNSA